MVEGEVEVSVLVSEILAENGTQGYYIIKYGPL